TMLGSHAGSQATTGEYNVMIGSLAGSTNTADENTGSRNVFIGRQAGYFCGAGNNNVAVGYTAGENVSTSGNVFIGYGAGAGTTVANRLYISSASGNLIYGEFDNKLVGINVTTPTQTLDVNGNARFRSIGSGAYSGVVNRMADGTLTTATSDIRLKENVSVLENSLSKVLKLRGVNFTWKANPELGNRIGFIAQEVEAVLPELVFTNENDGYKGVNYAEMTAVLVEAVKEQQKQIEALKAELEALKKIVKK
ncbi:MAG: tail fiber domain-containing protein, partial [Bacteroidales bacterium]